MKRECGARKRRGYAKEGRGLEDEGKCGVAPHLGVRAHALWEAEKERYFTPHAQHGGGVTVVYVGVWDAILHKDATSKFVNGTLNKGDRFRVVAEK